LDGGDSNKLCNFEHYPTRVDQNLIGELCIPAKVLEYPLDGIFKLFFVFEDIGIRNPGIYKFQYHIVHIPKLTTMCISGHNFAVISKRNHRRIKDKTLLEKSFEQQGIIDKASKRYANILISL